MKNLTFDNITLVILGVLIHIGFHILNRRNKNINFSFSVFVSDVFNWIRLFLAFASAFALLIMMDDIASFVGVKMPDGTYAKGLVSFTIGYLNHSVIRNIMKVRKIKNN